MADRPPTTTQTAGVRPARMPRLLENALAVYELARLGVISGFRFRGPYWQWRLHTAFGRGYPTSRRELVRSVLAYGRWIRQMRRMGRG